MHRNLEVRRDDPSGTLRARPWSVVAEVDCTHDADGAWMVWDEITLARFATYQQAAAFARAYEV